MICIHKFEWQYEINLFMPQGARILSMQMQKGSYYIWACIDTDAPMVMRDIVRVGSGWEMTLDISDRFVATIQHGPFVWHFFDNGEMLEVKDA